MNTELIASTNNVNVKGKDMVIVVTKSNQTVWVPKAQFDSSAESITYNSLSAGAEYTKKDGTKGVLVADRNEFVGTSKQIVEKSSAKDLLDHLISKGITPTFNLG